METNHNVAYEAIIISHRAQANAILRRALSNICLVFLFSDIAANYMMLLCKR